MWEGWTSVGDSECHQSTNSQPPTANGQPATSPPTTSAHPLCLHWLRHPGLAHRNGDRLFLGSSIVHQLSDIAADGLL